MDNKCLVSRKPIFHSKLDVAAYEVVGDDDASRAIFGMLSESGLDPILGDRPGYLNISPAALAEGAWKRLPADRMVLGFFDEFQPSDPAAEHLTMLVRDGYRIALSDRLCPESLGMLGDSVEVIKVDVTQYAPDLLENRVQELKKYKSKILADKVDTYDDLEFCKTLDFDLYTGRFLAKPAAQKNDALPVNRLAMLRLLAKLREPEITMQELDKLISQDLTLSYKLLVHANSGAVSLPQKVNSVSHALRLLGMNVLANWTSVLLLSSVEDKPRELMSMALIRARMCERLAEAVKKPDTDSFMLAGLFSVLDALLDCSMEQAISNLPLSDDVKAGLTKHTGAIGQTLRCTIAYEQGKWDDVQYYGLSPAAIREIYMEAIAWSRQLCSGLM
jgi:Predicted signal transduction protein containing EAL and modified HD-GYP domains